jgi:cell division protease FtsH
MKYLLGLFYLSLSFFSNGYLKNISWKYNPNSNIQKKEMSIFYKSGDYHFSERYYKDYLRRLNSKNITVQTNSILGLDEPNYFYNNNNNNNNNNTNPNNFDEEDYANHKNYGISQRYIYRKNQMNDQKNDQKNGQKNGQKIKIYMNKAAAELYQQMNGNNFDKRIQIFDNFGNLENQTDTDKDGENGQPFFRFPYSPPRSSSSENTKSENFEVVKNYQLNFTHIGGYQNIKKELEQCIDMLKNYQKYEKYKVRIPKGLIFEGPPGNGKTLLAKGLAGEAGCSFISVSGSDFQEKYIGVGPTRIKELFALAKKNVPCIIFIDEIDAVGRKRSGDGETSSGERDNTLNALLVEMDGFKNNTGIFVVGATNRVDLLDNALMRPGRIDKKIYIGMPDATTREAIINIHIQGKPYGESIILKDLMEITEGYSGAQIENLLNEAMLNALREDRTEFTYQDFDMVLNKMIAGWQPNEHEFTSDIIDHIAIHEMGHAIVGILSKHHSKMSKVIINLSSPKSPGYTVFETSTSNIYKRESLFEHLMILLAGRIAEEIFYDVSVTTGAINDFEEALKLAEKMVVYYGMGRNVIYPNLSEKYKEFIDDDVAELISDAYRYSHIILLKGKDLIAETAEMLKKDKMLKAKFIQDLIEEKYSYLL